MPACRLKPNEPAVDNLVLRSGETEHHERKFGRDHPEIVR